MRRVVGHCSTLLESIRARSGRSVRTIGYSPTARSLLTIITITEDVVTYGVNGWQSNDTDVKRYREESP